MTGQTISNYHETKMGDGFKLSMGLATVGILLLICGLLWGNSILIQTQYQTSTSQAIQLAHDLATSAAVWEWGILFALLGMSGAILSIGSRPK